MRVRALPGRNPDRPRSGAGPLGKPWVSRSLHPQRHNRKRTETLSLPPFPMRQLLEAGVHFGHHPRRWNPKMAPFLFGVRNGIHIIDLEQTVPMLDQAVKAVRDVAASGGRVLFVGTKRAASDKVADAAKRCGQY